MTQTAPDTPRRTSPAIYYGALFGAGALLFILGLWPGLGHPLGDKAEHILAFGLVAIVLRRSGTFLAHWRTGFVLLVLVAIGLELAQDALSPTRFASWSDGAASLIGAATGFLIGGLKRLRHVVLGIIWLIPFALSANWAINHGRYKLFNQLGIEYCKDAQQKPTACHLARP